MDYFSIRIRRTFQLASTELADQVIDMADKTLHAVPSKENLLYLSAAYAKKEIIKKLVK